MPKYQTKEDRALIDLLNAYSDLCPSDKDRKAIWAMVMEMFVYGKGNRAVCKAICGRLYDGLAYGNWPSSLENMD